MVRTDHHRGIMALQVFPITILLLTTSVMAIGLMVLVWPRRSSPGIRYFLLFLSGLVIWTLGAGIESSVLSIPEKVLWSQIEYIGFVMIAPAIYLFTDEYCHQALIPFRRTFLIWILPLVTLILVWTNSRHGWVWTGFKWGVKELNVLTYEHGLWYYIHAFYVYFLSGLAALNLFIYLLKARKPYRNQVIILLASFIFPVISGTIYMLGLEPVPGMDTAELGFFLTACVMTWDLLRYRLFDLVPIARDLVIEKMGDGILVIDENQMIVDVNPAAKNLLNDGKVKIGENLGSFIARNPILEPLQDQTINQRIEISLPNGDIRQLDFYKVPIAQERGVRPGVIITFHDSTYLQIIEQRAAAVAERQHLGRELHDRVAQNLYSLSLFAASSQEYARQERWDKTQENLEDIHQLASQSLKEMRLLLFELRPDSFDQVGLVQAIRERLNAVEHHSQIQSSLIADEELNFPPGLERTLYGITTEALNNVLKHSRAKHVDVHIQKVDGNAVLTIQDDGEGFDVDHPSENGGMGLLNTRQRVTLAHGEMELKSSPGGGTYLRISCPITE